MELSDLLTFITQIFTGTSTGGNADNNGIIAWVGSVISMITSNPLIMLFVVLTVALVAIGVVRRLIRL